MVLYIGISCFDGSAGEMINDERFAHIWERQKGRKVGLWVVACAAVYAIIFIVSGSWHIFLIANPTIPVQVGDCIIQRRTVCHSANLEQAQLIRASLHGADLRGANLRGANLWHAELVGADLTGADLTGADLRRADLTGANISHTILRDTNLQGTDLRGVDLTSVNLREVTYSTGTLWPADMDLEKRRELFQEK